MAFMPKWPPDVSLKSELPAALFARLNDAEVPGFRSCGFTRDTDGLIAEVKVFPLTRAVQAQVVQLCKPFRSRVTQGSQELPRRC